MVSERKRVANAQNAKRSTGPRTQAGKAASRHNALRHGLAIPIVGDLTHTAEINELAGMILDGIEDRAALSYAQIVAEQSLELCRIGAAKTAVLGSALADAEKAAADQDDEEASRDEGEPLADAAAVLRSFERYERRAISRRKTAMRDLLACLRVAGSKSALTRRP